MRTITALKHLQASKCRNSEKRWLQILRTIGESCPYLSETFRSYLFQLFVIHYVTVSRFLLSPLSSPYGTDEVRSVRRQNLLEDRTIGFVPTMGALHSGHIKLMERAKMETDVTVTSIFVNPTQFSAGEDLHKYPRPLEQDIEMLEKADVDILFLPDHDTIYPGNSLCHVEPAAFSHISEGKARPDFFRGK